MKIENKPLSCEMARDMMFDHLDGLLSERDTERLMTHINTCEACKAELEERRKVLSLIREVELPAPEGFKDRVMCAIDGIPQDAKLLTTKKKFFIPWGTVAAACAVVMIMIAGRGAIGVGRSADMVEEGDLSLLRVNTPEDALMLDTEPTVDGAEVYSVYKAAADADNGDALYDDVIVYETTAGATMLSPSVTAQPEKELNAYVSIAPIDNLVVSASLNAGDKAILLVYARDAEGLAPEGEVDTFTESRYKVTRYTINKDAEATFGGYVKLFEGNKLTYRTVIPADAEFDTCEIWLLDADPADTVFASTKGSK